MKLIIAVIRPIKLSAVRQALEKIEVPRMTVCDAQDLGRRRPPANVAWERRQSPLLRKIVLEILVNDDFLERTVDTIASVARTGPEGTIGDGNIFIIPAEGVSRIDDGIQGPGAV